MKLILTVKGISAKDLFTADQVVRMTSRPFVRALIKQPDAETHT